MKRISLVFILLLFMTILGCYRRQATRGPEYQIFVFAENDDYNQLEKVLQDALVRTIPTPQPESPFTLVHVSDENFNQYLAHKQLLFAASLESEGTIADIVKRSVDQPERREKIMGGENFLFRKENHWTQDQLLLTIVTPTIPGLIDKIKENKDLLFNLFRDHQMADVKSFMYRKAEKTDLSDELMEKYQWNVRVQHDYFMAKEDGENQFVFLRRLYPERWFFVKWFEQANPNTITPQWYYDLRDSIGVKYYSGDKINRDYTEAKEITFLDRWCLKITGLWENDAKVVGGPFFAYAFYDEGTQRIYTIDCAVFAPSNQKMPYLDQLDVMAQTFKTKIEMQREAAQQ